MSHIGLIHAKMVNEIERSIKDDLTHTALYNHPINSVYVLDALYKKDNQRASDLAAAIGQPPTSFTPVLDRLETSGLITRSPHSKDRRAVVISLTPAGRGLKKAIENALATAEVRYGGK